MTDEHDALVEMMRTRGFEPAVPFPGALDPWDGICVQCRRPIASRFARAISGHPPCDNCDRGRGDRGTFLQGDAPRRLEVGCPSGTAPDVSSELLDRIVRRRPPGSGPARTVLVRLDEGTLEVLNEVELAIYKRYGCPVVRTQLSIEAVDRVLENANLYRQEGGAEAKDGALFCRVPHAKWKRLSDELYFRKPRPQRAPMIGVALTQLIDELAVLLHVH